MFRRDQLCRNPDITLQRGMLDQHQRGVHRASADGHRVAEYADSQLALFQRLQTVRCAVDTAYQNLLVPGLA